MSGLAGVSRVMGAANLVARGAQVLKKISPKGAVKVANGIAKTGGLISTGIRKAKRVVGTVNRVRKGVMYAAKSLPLSSGHRQSLGNVNALLKAKVNKGKAVLNKVQGVGNAVLNHYKGTMK